MATKTVGTLIKEARTAAGLSQAALANEVGMSASEIGKAERSEKDLTNDQLKAIAKATGVTQKSLLDAAAGKKTTGKTATAAKKPAASTAKTAAKSSMQVTAAEKRLVELYRKADTDTQKEVMNLLKGSSSDMSDLLGALLGGASGSSSGSGKNDAGLLGSLLSQAAGSSSGSGKNDTAAMLASLLGGKTGSSSSSGKKDDTSAMLGALLSQLNKK